MNDKTTKVSTSTGISTLTAVGAAIAVQISWGLAHSIPYAAWHGLLGWFYVLYRWLIAGYLP